MSGYLAVLRAGRIGWLELATLVGRLPIGINGLAIVLFLKEETGSFAPAGAVAGGMALGIGLGAPMMGRWVDRRGTGVLMLLACAHAAGILALLALGKADAPTAALVAVAALTGAAFPPSPSVLRARFPALLRDRPDLMQSAYALDSVLLELSFVTAPLIVAVVVAVLDPAAALVAAAVTGLAGTAAFVALLPKECAAERPEGGRDLLGPLRSPGIRALVITMLPVGFGIGAVEVSLPAFSEAEGHRELAGVLLATWSIGSAIGGFVYGVRPRTTSVARAHLRFALLLPLGFLPALLAPSMAAMALLIVPAGLFIAPRIATRNELASTIAPPGTPTEALTWPLTTLVGGIAIGAAAGGALADAEGWRAVLVAAVIAGAMGAAVATSRRGTLATATATA
ncbi:MAG TPA: MFS transporter [Solirubrobacteraceae bacterium]|nr:MFS transporter [Solirubrobacteraceae bacterium]